jgi:LacI family transcriptional regulator
LGRGIEALIICLTAESLIDSSLLDKFREQNIKCVVFDRWSPIMDYSSVTIDNEGGAYSAVKYLIDKGHRKIACLAGPLSSYSAQNRLKGYEKALIDSGIEIKKDLIAVGNYQFSGGYEQGLKLLDKDITAVFVCNDMMAYGFYKIAHEKDKKIPEDLSVIGFDDLFFSSMLDVPLTTVRQNIDKLSFEVCNLVIKSLNGNENIEHLSLETTISERDSVKDI